MRISMWLWIAGLGAALVSVSAEGAPSGVGWKVGDWKPCEETCGTQMRNISCWDYGTQTSVASNMSCPTNATRPDSTRECPGCEVLMCPGSWTPGQCACCPTGIVGKSGACCVSDKGLPASLDKDGECCYDRLDACGVCGGSGVMRDSFGGCCQEGERVDGMGKCCPVAEIDACGVCEGLNNTCGATIRLLIVVDPQADGDTVTTVRNYISNTLRYPLALVQVGELEAMDMTEVLPFAGVLTGDTDTDAFNDESKDFMFGRVTVELAKLGTEAGSAHALVDLHLMSAALNNGTNANYSGIVRFFPVSVMRACGDGMCSPGENPLDTYFGGPNIHGKVIFNSNGTAENTSEWNSTVWNGTVHNNSTWGTSSGSWNGTNSTSGFNGTFERADPMQPPVCKADCTSFCPVQSPPGHKEAMPMECSGRGICIGDQKTCDCYDGFDGMDCAKCAPGYTLTPGGFCVQPPTPCDSSGGSPDTNTTTNSPTDPKGPGKPGDTNTTTPPTDPKQPDPTPPPRTEFSKKFSDWTECTSKCGGGEQTRTWTCVDDNGEEVGIENCMDHPAKDALAQQCNLLPCETFSFVKSEWKPCSQTCGTGYTTRRLTCFSSYGYAVSASQCECTDGDCDTFKTCKTNACEEPYHTFSGYSACSVACGGGVKSRTATCNNPDGTVAAASVCEDARLIDERAEVACNTVTCKADSFIWRTGAWSTCTPLACGGTRTREVTCRNAYDGVLASTVTACLGMKPDTEQSCAPCGFCEDPVLSESCSGNGVCVDDACDCVGDWDGAICDVDTNLCPASGRLDRDGNCCVSGVLSSSGTCCDSQTGSIPILDGDGQCCGAGFIDACGICGGSNIGTDVFGVCCPAGGVFDTQARCCASGNMDACGLCDGTGDSCKTNAVVETQTSASRRRSLLQTSNSALVTFFANLLNYAEDLVTVVGRLKPGDATTTLANMTLEATSGVATATNAISGIEEIAAAMELARADPNSAITISSSPVITKVPECGDDLCSPGEARTRDADLPPYYCEADCPIVLGTCPSPGTSELGNATLECGGLGSCARASLTCVCFASFDGEACGYCAEGFRRVGDGCEVITSLIVPAPVDVPPPRSIGGPSPETDSGGAETNVGLIVGLTVLCVAITGAAVGAGYAYKTGRIGRRNQSDQFGVDVSLA